VLQHTSDISVHVGFEVLLGSLWWTIDLAGNEDWSVFHLNSLLAVLVLDHARAILIPSNWTGAGISVLNLGVLWLDRCSADFSTHLQQLEVSAFLWVTQEFIKKVNMPCDIHCLDFRILHNRTTLSQFWLSYQTHLSLVLVAVIDTTRKRRDPTTAIESRLAQLVEHLND
jgi:hypothetical protein